MARMLLFVMCTMLAIPTIAEARIQRDLVCWVPDCEFPVDCDEDED